MAFTAVIGIATSTTAVTAVTVLAAVAEIGMAMTVVGAVTGNKSLLKIGGAMSLIGGVGGMMAGAAGGAGAGAAAADSAAGIGADAATSAAWGEGAAGLGGDTLTAMGADVGGSALNSGIISGAQAGGDIAMTTAMNPTDMRLASGTATTPGNAAAGNAAQATVNDVAGATGPAGAQGPNTPYSMDPTAVSSPMAPIKSGNFLDGFTNFAKNNKNLLETGVKMISGGLQGANQSDQFQQKLALEKSRVDQTGYGNTVANFRPTGIIAGAQQ